MGKPTRFTPEMFEEYTRKGYWESRTISDFWKANARDFPEKEAVADSKNRLTWREADRWIDRLALGFIELGIQKDEMVVIQLPNSVALCLLRVACERAGILCLPLWRTWRHREMAYTLERVEAVGVVIPWKLRGFDHFAMIQEVRSRLPKLKHIIVADEEAPEGVIRLQDLLQKPLEEKYPRAFLDAAKCKAEEFSLVLPTTGTTGFPKFVENPICSFVCREKACVANLKITSEDVMAGLTPAGGGSNGRVYVGAPLAAARIVMLEHFSPQEALELIQKEKVTIAPMVPAQAAMMINHPGFENYDVSSLRLVISMGAPLPFDVAVEVERRLSCIIVQNYSSIDCSAACMGSIEDPPEVRLRTVGKPYAGAEVKLVGEKGEEVPGGEAGEIFMKGPGAVSGYYKDSEATWQVWSKDGWYRTGDLGKFDEQGNLIIAGRKKDMIIRGGQNIYPVEIESLLTGHPKVSNMAIVKMPDPVMGERACAYVVSKGEEDLTFEEMVSFLKGKGLSAYKLPERLEIVDALPMVAEGQKVDKKALEEKIAEKLKAEGNR